MTCNDSWSCDHVMASTMSDALSFECSGALNQELSLKLTVWPDIGVPATIEECNSMK